MQSTQQWDPQLSVLPSAALSYEVYQTRTQTVQERVLFVGEKKILQLQRMVRESQKDPREAVADKEQVSFSQHKSRQRYVEEGDRSQDTVAI